MEKSRPLSAYPLPNKVPKIGHGNLNMKETNFKDRSSPHKFSNFYTKEDLHQTLQSLKSQINELKSENKMLKAKIVKLERKKNAFPYTLASKSHSNLLSDPEKQKNILKFAEIEFENKLLRDDIMKYKKMIDELTENPPPDYKKIYEKYVKQCVKIKKLKNEIQKQSFVKNGKEMEKNASRSVSPAPNPKRNESSRGKIKPKIEEYDSYKGIVAQIYECSCKNKLEIDEIWYVMNPNGQYSITFVEFSRGIKGLGIEIPIQTLENFFNFISKEIKLTQNQFENALKSLKPLFSLSFSELKSPVKHLLFKLQIQRLNFSNFIQMFPGQIIKINEFCKILMNSPLQIEKEIADVLAKFIFENNSSLEFENIEKKMKSLLGNWKIFTEDEEIEFDEEIKNKLGKRWDELLQKCSEMDKENKEVIKYYDFKRICNELGFDLNGDIENYLQVLFYTDKFLLDIVPYLSFIKAYSLGDN